MDPDQAALKDLVRQRRIDEIYSLKQSVQQLEEDIARGLAASRLSGDPDTAYLLLVQSYVRSLETLLDDSHYWDKAEVGRYTLPEGTVRVVQGLEGFLNLELSEEVSWEVEEAWCDSSLPSTTTKSTFVRPPRRIPESAFSVANTALRDAGVEIETEETTVDKEYATEAPGIGG